MTVIHTGKHLDPETAAYLQELHRNAQDTPVILLTQRHLGPHGKDEATLAWERFHQAMNEAAAELGLPAPRTFIDEDGDEAIVNYGCHFESREVLGWEPDPI